ncbi:MAG: pantoate--beta-alanine ligase [Dehalococcoidia bacterium]
MHHITTIADLRAFLCEAPRPVGLVPTMGALHAGHRGLLDQARRDCATVVASVFVNPKQFSPQEDFSRYPRPLEHDLAMLEDTRADVAFVPGVDEMYAADFATTVAVGGPALSLEGAVRPGHFDGVATVVAKLFLQAGPDLAYFGQKDGQQAAVIKRMAADLDIPVRVVVMPTVREPDGLAVSSRNAYLTPEQRAAAPILFRALSASRDLFRAGSQDKAKLEALCRRWLETEPLLEAIDYVAAVDMETMEPWRGRGPCMLGAAVRIGGVRLIDNVILD